MAEVGGFALWSEPETGPKPKTALRRSSSQRQHKLRTSIFALVVFVFLVEVVLVELEFLFLSFDLNTSLA